MVKVTGCGKVHTIISLTKTDISKYIDSDEKLGTSIRLGKSFPLGGRKMWSEVPQLYNGEKNINLICSTGSMEDEMLSGGIKKLGSTTVCFCSEAAGSHEVTLHQHPSLRNEVNGSLPFILLKSLGSFLPDLSCLTKIELCPVIFEFGRTILYVVMSHNNLEKSTYGYQSSDYLPSYMGMIEDLPLTADTANGLANGIGGLNITVWIMMYLGSKKGLISNFGWRKSVSDRNKSQLKQLHVCEDGLPVHFMETSKNCLDKTSLLCTPEEKPLSLVYVTGDDNTKGKYLLPVTEDNSTNKLGRESLLNDQREEPVNIQGKKSLLEDARGKRLKEEEGKRMPYDGREKLVNNHEWKSLPHDPGDKSVDSSVLNERLITGGKRLSQVLNECLITGGKRLSQVLSEWLVLIMTLRIGGTRLLKVLSEWLVWIMTLRIGGTRLLKGIAKWLVRVQTFFTGGKRLSQVLVLFYCVLGTSSICSFRNNYMILDQEMSSSTLVIDICYDEMECSKKSFRWDKNGHHIYLGSICQWQHMKYSILPIQTDQNSTCIEMKIHDIMPDDLRSNYTFTLKFWPIRVSPEKQPIPIGQPYIVCNESRGLPMLTSRLKYGGSQDLSKTVQIYSEKQDEVEKINSTVSVENGNISVVITDDLSSCYITVKYPYKGHEFILMRIYLTKEDIEMCAAKPSTPTAMTEKNGSNVGVVVAVCLVALLIIAIIAIIIKRKKLWLCFKQYEDRSFVSLICLCKRYDQRGRNGEEEKMYQKRDDILI